MLLAQHWAVLDFWVERVARLRSRLSTLMSKHTGIAVALSIAELTNIMRAPPLQRGCS